MRKNQLISVLSLFLLVPASITRAQTTNLTGTVSIEQDYRVVNFNSPKGNVKVILPGVLSGPGQGTVLLSGTVMAEPSGKTEKERSGNLKALQKMLLIIGGNSIAVLSGQNHFDFSMPANSTTPVPVTLAGTGGNTATVMLKNPVVSPISATGTIPVGQPALSTDQKVFLTDGDISVYTPNSTSTQFQSADKFFIKDATGNMREATKITQSPTQTVLSSEGVQPGAITIIRQSGNRTDQVNVRMASLTLSSTDNDLRKGQTSSLMATIDPKITEKESNEPLQIPTMSLDLRNLTPNVVEMSGGNMQVMTYPETPGSTSPAAWQQTRTITGVIQGSFNITASLYPSSSISNNPALTQQKALTNCAQYNTWVNSVKKQLEDFIKVAVNNDSKDYARHVISSLPSCSNEEDLDLDKMVTTNLLRDLPPASKLTTGLPALAAYQAASNNLLSQGTPVQDFVHTDVINNGLNYLQQASKNVKNPELVKNMATAQQATTALHNNYSTKNISTLSSALQQLNTSAFVNGIFMQMAGRYTDGTTPPTAPGELIENAGCPQNFVSSRENVVIMARGCTETEAKAKVYKELLKKAKKLRQDMKVGDCAGVCPDGGECTLTTPIGDGELTCVPADVPGCDGGFVCVYIGPVRAECLCAL